jgi:hypothetical protein
MGDNRKNDVLTLQAALKESIEPDYLLGLEMDDLNVLVRLTVEFWYFLQQSDHGTGERAEVRYACESVFSGIESFCQMSSYYRMLSAESPTAGDWNIASLAHFRDLFAAQYRQLSVEETFPIRCRILLELFKLQIVFAGMVYE